MYNIMSERSANQWHYWSSDLPALMIDTATIDVVLTYMHHRVAMRPVLLSV